MKTLPEPILLQYTDNSLLNSIAVYYSITNSEDDVTGRDYSNYLWV